MNPLLERLLAITPDELAAMPGSEREWVLDTLDKEIALASPAAFAVRHSNGAWQPYRHLVYTSERIVAMIERNEVDCLLIEEPVRHGKSELCSKWTPAWFICKYGLRVGLASYEGDFAATWGRKVREIVMEVGPRYGRVIDQSSRAANRWDLVGSDGGMFTAGAGGPITGKGAPLLIVDDPIKNDEQASSATERDRLWDWWQQTWLSRREPFPNGGLTKLLVIMSRWHHDDLLARIIAHETDLRRVDAVEAVT